MTIKTICINLIHALKIFFFVLPIFTVIPGCQDGQDGIIDETVEVHSVSGIVSGLADGQQVVLQNNLTDSLTITANGIFSFPEFIPFGKSYAVNIATQPSLDPFQGCSVSNGSGIISSDVINVTVGCGPIVSTLAGSGVFGSKDGQGVEASFSGPRSIVLDKSGNAYVTDYWSSVIRRIDSNGNVTTFAGSGSRGYIDAQGKNASFSLPMGLIFDENNNLYVADSMNNAIRKIDPSGNVTTFARVQFPTGVALDKNGNLYVAQYSNNLISKVDKNGAVTVFAGSGTPGNSDGQGAMASFDSPYALAFDSKDNLYVSDLRNNKIRKIDSGGHVTTFVGAGAIGSADGQGTAASFNGPMSMAFDANDNLYLADNSNNKIRKIDISAKVTSLVGTISSGSIDGQGAVASFSRPMGVAIDKIGGELYVADYLNNKIRKISPGVKNM